MDWTGTYSIKDEVAGTTLLNATNNGDITLSPHGKTNVTGDLNISGYTTTPQGSNVAAAATITPTGAVFAINGTTTVINTINLPYTGFNGSIKIIPLIVFTTGTSGNIKGPGSTAVIGKLMELYCDGTYWYPSY